MSGLTKAEEAELKTASEAEGLGDGINSERLLSYSLSVSLLTKELESFSIE